RRTLPAVAFVATCAHRESHPPSAGARAAPPLPERAAPGTQGVFMMLLIAIVVGALVGAAASGEAGALAGALFGWLIMRSLRQQREIESLRKRADVAAPVAIERASADAAVADAPRAAEVAASIASNEP